MNRETHSDTGETTWTWILLAVLLVAAALMGVGALGLTSLTTQGQLATGSQSMPSR